MILKPRGKGLANIGKPPGNLSIMLEEVSLQIVRMEYQFLAFPRQSVRAIWKGEILKATL